MGYFMANICNRFEFIRSQNSSFCSKKLAIKAQAKQFSQSSNWFPWFAHGTSWNPLLERHFSRTPFGRRVALLDALLRRTMKSSNLTIAGMPLLLISVASRTFKWSFKCDPFEEEGSEGRSSGRRCQAGQLFFLD